MAFVPIGSTGKSQQNQLTAEQQQQQVQGASLANTILESGKLVQAKKAEAQRQFENAQKLMREDLNTISGFDVSALGGPNIAKGMKEYADMLSQKIREANDPIAAQKMVDDFRKKYDYLKNAKAQRDEARNTLVGLYGASEEDIDSINSGLPAGKKVKIPGLNDIYAADKAYDREIVVTDDMQLMVSDGKGGLMPLENDEKLIDPSGYQFQTEDYDLGGIDTWAKSEATYKRTDDRTGSWNAMDAQEVYTDDITSVNPNGQYGGNAKRNMVLQSLEARGLIPYISQDEELRRKFEAGEFDFDRVWGFDYSEENGEKTRVLRVPTSQLTEEEKMFRMAIQKGEELFVEESRHVTIPKRGDGSEAGFSDKVIRGGYAVPVGPSAAALRMTGALGEGATDPLGNVAYNINRFRTPLTMNTGLSTESGNYMGRDANGNFLTVAGASSDGSYDIVGAGYDPQGRLVATVSTEVTRMVPEYEGSNIMVEETRTVNRPLILTDLNGEPPEAGSQLLEIYNAVTQNPDMAPILAADRAEASQNVLRALENPVEPPPAEYSRGTDQATRDRNVDTAAEIMETIPEGVREQVIEAIEERARGRSRVDELAMPRIENGQVVFYDDRGERIEDMDPIPMPSEESGEEAQPQGNEDRAEAAGSGPRLQSAGAGAGQGGGRGFASANRGSGGFGGLSTASVQPQGQAQPQAQEQQAEAPATTPEEAALRMLQSEEENPNRRLTRAERREGKRRKREFRRGERRNPTETIQGRGVDLVPTSAVDQFIMRGPEAQPLPPMEPLEPEEIELARQEIAKEEEDAFWTDVREKSNNGENFWGTELADDNAVFEGNGINTITDEKSLKRAIDEFGDPPRTSPYYDLAKNYDLLRGLTDEQIREIYFERVAANEGYRADGIVINVPPIGSSGVTVAGLDISSGGLAKVAILEQYIDDPKQVKALKTLVGLKRDKAQEALDKLQAQGLLTKEALGLTQEDLNNITADQGEASYQDFVNKVGSEKKLRELPIDVLEGMLDVHFNVPGSMTEGPGNPLPELERFLNKDNPSRQDAENLARRYDLYWGTPEEVQIKLEQDTLSNSNVRRAQAAAAALREYGETLPEADRA